MIEEWRDVPGYEGQYQVSDMGRVRSVDRVKTFPAYTTSGGIARAASVRRFKGKMLRPGPQPSGHLSVAIGKGNSRQVHQLVMEAFVGACPPEHEVLHGDGNPANNALTNLRYGTRKENNEDVARHERRRLTCAQVRYLRQRAKEGFYYGERHQLAQAWGVNSGTIYHTVKGNQYAAVR